MVTTNVKFLLSGLLFALALLALPVSNAHADCTNPADVEGAIVYNQDFGIMQYCNGTGWMSLGGGAGLSTETDPKVDAVTNLKWCRGTGSTITCDQNTPSLTETDPKVGTITANQWCTANSGATAVECTQTTPAGPIYGILVMTTAERNALSSPADGTLILNSSTESLNIYSAGTWREFYYSCPENYMEYNGNCYRYVSTGAAHATARTNCAADGGTLARAANLTEFNFLVTLPPNNYAGEIWIDGDDIAPEGTFKYSDGTNVSYFNWGLNQPNNSSGNEDCMAIFGGAFSSASYNNLMDDDNCADANPYICELE